jgi:hypothetical protein
MASTLRSRFENDDWLKLLKPNRQEKIENEWKKLKVVNMEIDRILATQFCDKRDAILKSGTHPSAMTYNQAEQELRRVEELRNHVAHAGDIASTEAKALQAVKTVKLARQWIMYLTDLLAARSHSPSTA